MERKMEKKEKRERKRLGDSHSNFSVIACRSEHARICRIPRHSIDTPAIVARESLDERAILLLPYVDFGIYNEDGNEYLRKSDGKMVAYLRYR